MKTLNLYKKENYSKPLYSREGQSLIEILVAISVGVIIIGGAVFALFSIIDSAIVSGQQQTATFLAEEQALRLSNLSGFNWSNIYNLDKGSDSPYHLVASSTQFLIVPGKEGVLGNDLESGLVGYWKMDEETGDDVYDYSGNNNIGSLQNNPTRATSSVCRIGGCLSFDGSNSVSITSSDYQFSFEDDFSASIWINVSGVPGTGNVMGIFGRQSGDRWAMDYWFDGERLRLGVRNSSTWHTTTLFNTNNHDEWHHLALVHRSGDVLEGYLNGESIGTVDISSADWSLNDGNVVIASSNAAVGGTPRNLIGLTDDARIYDRALSEDDINHIYNTDVFERYFYVENICRSDDTNYEIVGTTPCGSLELEDPTTQKITTVVEWPARRGGGTSSFVFENYITRWQNSVFEQTDWSGGAGFEGPTSESVNQFATSSIIDFSESGIIKVELEE